MVKVKICGITNLEDALMAQDAGADILGFVFANSPRQVDINKVNEIIGNISSYIKVAVLFVNAEASLVHSTVSLLARVDMLQFHGHESGQYCMQFKSHNREIIKALRVRDESSLADGPVRSW